MNTITARHLGRDRFAITTRDHTFTIDQPVSDGGDNTASTPTELFVASLVGCVGFYARRYLARHGLSADGLTVTASYAMAPRPARVSDITIAIDLPHGVPVERRDAFLAVASHCTVHNSLTDPPSITIRLSDNAIAD
jgi:putative redox protein